MPSTSSVTHLKHAAFLGLACAFFGATVLPAAAQTVRFGHAYQSNDNSSASSQQNAPQHGGERFHAEGHRPPPPGYQDTPSMEFQNGPDPDHQAQLKSHRDSVTGANLGAFGTAYQQSSPTQSGQLGDATGNGWVAPRGNGF